MSSSAPKGRGGAFFFFSSSCASPYTPAPPPAQHWFTYLFEVMWAFSIWLEAIAICPQLILLQRNKSAENLTASYMASLGAYRALYILNWIYRCGGGGRLRRCKGGRERLRERTDGRVGETSAGEGSLRFF